MLWAIVDYQILPSTLSNTIHENHTEHTHMSIKQINQKKTCQT
jgi:hypothetical protein